MQIVELAHYAHDMALVRALLNHLFDAPEVILSERASPYWGPADAEPARAAAEA